MFSPKIRNDWNLISRRAITIRTHHNYVFQRRTRTTQKAQKQTTLIKFKCNVKTSFLRRRKRARTKNRSNVHEKANESSPAVSRRKKHENRKAQQPSPTTRYCIHIQVKYSLLSHAVGSWSFRERILCLLNLGKTQDFRKEVFFKRSFGFLKTSL